MNDACDVTRCALQLFTHMMMGENGRTYTLWPKVIWSKNLATTKQPAYYEILHKINVGGEAKAAAEPNKWTKKGSLNADTSY